MLCHNAASTLKGLTTQWSSHADDWLTAGLQEAVRPKERTATTWNRLLKLRMSTTSGWRSVMDAIVPPPGAGPGAANFRNPSRSPPAVCAGVSPTYSSTSVVPLKAVNDERATNERPGQCWRTGAGPDIAEATNLDAKHSTIVVPFPHGLKQIVPMLLVHCIGRTPAALKPTAVRSWRVIVQ